AAQQAAAKQAAAQQAAAKQAALQQAAAKQVAAKQAALQQAAAKQAALQQAAAKQGEPSVPAQPAVGKAPAARSASAAPKKRGRPAAPSRKPGAKPAAPGRKVLSKKARVGSAASSMGENENLAEDTKSKTPLLIGGGIAVVILIVLGAVMMSEDEVPVVVESVVDKEPEVDLKKIREDEARLALDRVEKSNSEDPTDRVSAANRLSTIMIEFANTESAVEAAQLREQLLKDWQVATEQAWTSIKENVRAAFQDGDFEKASGLVEELPKVFDGAQSILSGSFETELDNLRIDTAEQLRFKKRLDELSDKAGNYARKGYEDIAIAIIQALPEKVEEEAPDVWRIKEELVKTIQRDGLALLLDREEAQEEQIAEARLLEQERKKAERERRWVELRDSVKWTSLLGRSNLYNWVSSSDRGLISSGQPALWRIVEREGLGVMVGDNRSGKDMYTGVYSNHWEDFVCQFEVSLKTGTLRISPRSQSRPNDGAIIDQTSPMFELGEDFPKNRWVSVTIEVHGDTVLLKYGDSQTELSLDPATTRLPSTGGFVFWIGDGTRVEIRDVRVKLVSDTRDGGIFAK
ncbi:MAG: hypothetical protein AAEJ04_06375, partial [Planctomycetota bacterium]